MVLFEFTGSSVNVFIFRFVHHVFVRFKRFSRVAAYFITSVAVTTFMKMFLILTEMMSGTMLKKFSSSPVLSRFT